MTRSETETNGGVLRRPSSAPTAQSRGIYTQASGEVTRRVPGIGQERRTSAIWGEIGSGHIFRARLTVCGICYWFGGQVRWVSGWFGAPKGYRGKPSAAGDAARRWRTVGFCLCRGGEPLLMVRSAVVLGANGGHQSSAETPVWLTGDVRLCSRRLQRGFRRAATTATRFVIRCQRSRTGLAYQVLCRFMLFR